MTIHPWVDGNIASKREQTSLLDLPSESNLDEVNGRTTRLLMNILQSHFGLPMSKVRKQDKAEYIQALIDAREAEDEGIFIDKMMALHCADLERQIKDFEEDTSVEDVQKENADVQKELPERQHRLLAMISAEPTLTLEEMSRKLSVSVKTLQRDFAALGIVRKGGRKNGHWEVKSRF